MLYNAFIVPHLTYGLEVLVESISSLTPPPPSPAHTHKLLQKGFNGFSVVFNVGINILKI